MTEKNDRSTDMKPQLEPLSCPLCRIRELRLCEFFLSIPYPIPTCVCVCVCVCVCIEPQSIEHLSWSSAKWAPSRELSCGQPGNDTSDNI